MQVSKRKYKCVIVDDDFSSIGVLSHYISLIPKLELIKSFQNPRAAVEQIKKMKELDFLFLDINMPLSGLDIAMSLREVVNYIVFVTGHSENALAAFQVQADDFVVKPVSFSKFIGTVNRALLRTII